MWAPGLLTWRRCVAQCSPSVRTGSVCLAGCLKYTAKGSVSVLQLNNGFDRYSEVTVMPREPLLAAEGTAENGEDKRQPTLLQSAKLYFRPVLSRAFLTGKWRRY